MTDPVSPVDYYDLERAAAELGMDAGAVAALARRGEILATWVPSRQAFVFRPADLETYRAAHP
jgi:hypothetical protein